MLLATAVHELGHGFTTVRSGRCVNGVGLGWFWFGPVAFVDTSDMWLANKWERIAVTAAGPATNLILGGAASLLVFLVSSTAGAAALFQFAWLNYLMFALNLNPLMELDGYYLLMDWLERPNFRSKTLAWIGTELPMALRVPAMLRHHRTELIYGAASVLYVAVMSAVVAISVHRYFRVYYRGGCFLPPVNMAQSCSRSCCLLSSSREWRAISRCRRRVVLSSAHYLGLGGKICK